MLHQIRRTMARGSEGEKSKRLMVVDILKTKQVEKKNNNQKKALLLTPGSILLGSNSRFQKKKDFDKLLGSKSGR